jgi:hypothetical protein
VVEEAAGGIVGDDGIPAEEAREGGGNHSNGCAIYVNTVTYL